MTDNQPSRLGFNEMAFYLSGYLSGKESGRAEVEAEIAHLHAIAYRSVQANAKLDPHAVHWAKVRARQVEAAAHNQAAAEPWPDETDR